jgi:hypothetical protein
VTCGECPTCLERTNSLLRAPARRASRALPPPTADELLRHAEKFGPELVNETAAEHGLDVKVKAEDWKARRDRRRRRR